MNNLSRILLGTTVLLAVAVTLPVMAETPYTLTNTTTITKTATKGPTAMFVKKATVGGMFEVESSKLALNKSSNDDVKQFAQMMIDDHTAANEKLAAILADKNEQDLAPTALDAKHQAKLDALSSSDNFDADYLAAMKEGHVKTIALFKDYAANGDDADLKAFAKKTLPTLIKHKKHLEMIKA